MKQAVVLIAILISMPLWAETEQSAFLKYCLYGSGGDKSIEKTVNALKEYEGTEDCNLADVRLNRDKDIELQGGFESLLPLKGLKNLKKLTLGFKTVIDHKVPFPDLELSSLESLKIFLKQNFTSLENIKKLPKLKSLTISHPIESQLGFLKEMPSLESLSFPEGNIQNLSFLEGAAFSQNLHELFLRGNKISDLKQIVGFPHLKKIHLHHNQISDLAPLTQLQELEFAWLNDNKIQNIEPLAQIKSLRWIYLQKNKIEHAAPLTELPHLKELWIYDNPLKDAESLKTIKSIEVLKIKSL